MWSIDEGLLKQSLAAYPTLQAAIFPSRQAKLTPSESQDVTLYELLKVRRGEGERERERERERIRMGKLFGAFIGNCSF